LSVKRIVTGTFSRENAANQLSVKKVGTLENTKLFLSAVLVVFETTVSLIMICSPNYLVTSMFAFGEQS
jgi:uncharacterized membrane protein YidH (DUF202 family)